VQRFWLDRTAYIGGEGLGAASMSRLLGQAAGDHVGQWRGRAGV